MFLMSVCKLLFGFVFDVSESDECVVFFVLLELSVWMLDDECVECDYDEGVVELV